MHEKRPNKEFFLALFSCFPVFSEYRKIRPGKNSVFGHFSHGDVCLIVNIFVIIVSRVVMIEIMQLNDTLFH